MNVNYISESQEVLYSSEAVKLFTVSDTKFLKEKANLNSRKRIRVCAHNDKSDSLHEMLIIHERGAYVQPHKHPGKSESMHVVEGLVDVVMFDDAGEIYRVIRMGDYNSGKAFYYRVAAPYFHTLIIRSEVLVFHETTNGPFDRSTTIFAPWAPDDADERSVSAFMSDLDRKISEV